VIGDGEDDLELVIEGREERGVGAGLLTAAQALISMA